MERAPLPEGSVCSAMEQLNRGSRWKLEKEIPLGFACHHPQGLTKVGDHLFLSSVEILEPTVHFESPVNGLDRTAGRGRGHVFELDWSGRLLRQWLLEDAAAYHAGGIAFDGEHLWIPLAEYRPASRSVVIKLNLETCEATNAFDFGDHLGGLAWDNDTGLLQAMTWGSRQVLTLTTDGRRLSATAVESHFIDYQNCASIDGGQMVWSGVAEYPDQSGEVFELGGLAVVDVETGSVGHEVPVTAMSPGGHVVTCNATHLELAGDRLCLLAVPDDGHEAGESSLLVLEAALN